MKRAAVLIVVGVLVVILTALCVLISWEVSRNSKPSGFRLGLETVQRIQDGQISFEEKGEYILVSITDRHGDCHIHVLDYMGKSREQALKILKQKQAELKTIGQGVEYATGRQIVVRVGSERMRHVSNGLT